MTDTEAATRHAVRSARGIPPASEHPGAIDVLYAATGRRLQVMAAVREAANAQGHPTEPHEVGPLWILIAPNLYVPVVEEEIVTYASGRPLARLVPAREAVRISRTAFGPDQCARIHSIEEVV
jgi:hypothetical protein